MPPFFKLNTEFLSRKRSEWLKRLGVSNLTRGKMPVAVMADWSLSLRAVITVVRAGPTPTSLDSLKTSFHLFSAECLNPATRFERRTTFRWNRKSLWEQVRNPNYLAHDFRQPLLIDPTRTN